MRRPVLFSLILLLALPVLAEDKARTAGVEERNKAVARDTFEEVLEKGMMTQFGLLPSNP